MCKLGPVRKALQYFSCVDEKLDRQTSSHLVSVAEESTGIASHFVVLLGLGGRNWKGSAFPLFKESDWPMELGYTVLSFGGICRVDIEMNGAALSEGLNLEAEFFRCMVPNLSKSISHSPWMIVWSLYQNLQTKFVARVLRADIGD